MPLLPPTMTREQLEVLLHELQVQHIELQVQNRELQDAQAVIEESRSRYADLYDFAPIGYCTLDAAGHVKEANLTAARMFALRRNQLLGRHLTSLVSPPDRRGFAMHLARVLETAEHVTTEVTFTTRVGSRPLVVQLVSVKRHEGVLTALIDVSPLKELERRLGHLAYAGDVLGASLDEATTLSATSHLVVPRLADLCFIDLRDDDGHVTRPEVRFSDPALQARFADDVRKATLEPGWHTPQRQCMASGEPLLLEDAAMAGAAVQPPWLSGMTSMIVTPLKARKRVLGALTLVSSDPERRYQQSDLLFAQEVARRAAMALDNAHLHERSQLATRQRDNLLAMVSHDLKNPLAVVFMRAARLLRADLATDAKRARTWVESIRTAAERMKRLIGDLLEVTRIEAGGLAMDKALAPVGALLEVAVDELRPLAAERSIELIVEAPAGPLDVVCDRSRILQVFGNLLGNAIKFSPDGAAVTVRAEARASDVWFSVADRGPGLAPDHVAHVFDRFWQAKSTARLGTGLGLAIAKGIIDAHRGDIWAERREGGGSTFTFTLRQASAKLAVIIDDDPVDAELLSRALELEGYRVVVAEDGAKGLALLRQSPATVVLLDLHLPVMDGWQFLAERSRDPMMLSIPVVVVSGAAGVEERLRAEQVGHVTKPFLLPELLAAIERAVARA